MSALFKRAVSVLSALCQCARDGGEALRGRGCVQTVGGYMETTFRKYTAEKKETVMISCSEMHTDGTS